MNEEIRTVRDLLRYLQELPEDVLDLPVCIGDYVQNHYPISYIELARAGEDNSLCLEEGDEYLVIQQI